MDKIPTAQEFWSAQSPMKNIPEALIEFAQMHVEMALKTASESQYASTTGNKMFNFTQNGKEVIINSYSAEKIN